MSDTIELLEAIGSDASLRHASVEELTSRLKQAQASEALTAAAATGDSSLLVPELGHQPMNPPQGTQGPSHEEDEEEPVHEPHHHPAPDKGKSSPQH